MIKARTIEGASQRVQEDTIRFSRIMEGLGTAFIESVMVLIEYFPLLMGLSVGIPIMWFGDCHMDWFQVPLFGL